MKTLSERLIWARETKSDRLGYEYTQADLAKDIGVSQGSIAHLESGRSKSSRRITDIAEKLDVSATWLSTGKGDPQPTGSAPKSTPKSNSDSGRPGSVVAWMTLASEEELDLLDQYRRADEVGRKVIITAARRVKKLASSRIIVNEK